ncbi:hypothetical protein BCR32DRAFT_51516 [Anaeromyces robustus]|uniref:G-protein coupled receptors family 3 profile domain-containing protein n=1 Tax=Anaeromyces robustus TaxID=1754192 RepID=A0A1Y1WXQ0_9FUNG|nr:hypothetical protein BCR32DRAFT_51516 [Anaeromyces robustus]|eukprot:ORX78155.1 hypothetical protein BCR32DRAFT_51516 [Anaeromyces robustus]
MIDCEFYNNTAGLNGNTFMTLNKKALPTIQFKNISLIENYEKIFFNKNNFSTNPSYMICKPTEEKFSIYSGDILLKSIECYIYDDYDNEILLSNNIDNYEIKDLIYFSVTILNENKEITNVAKIYGSHNGYCWANKCNIGNLRVIGNEGNYKLLLKLESYGRYSPFSKNEIVIDVEIKKCNTSTHIYQDSLNIGLQSCYKPTCFQNCNTGKCINNDVCDCSNTTFTGKYCNEFRQYKKKKFIYIIYNTLTIFLILISILSIYLIHLNKNCDIVKAGSIDFSYIILIGSILNYFGILFELNSKGNIECYLSIISNQIGFTLTYGALLIKDFRIYKILLNDSHYEKVLTKKRMYFYLFIFLFLDFSLIIHWILNDNIGYTKTLNSNNQLYSTC